ncbi:MAG: hypothetical protein QOG43_763 [Actinomycetota bacterium]|jgi:hypothetical protein|nr:hypothetical protein [Actinomycetota bacterium]
MTPDHGSGSDTGSDTGDDTGDDIGDDIGAGGAVERYLDRLADAMVLRGRSVRRILAEADDHLREAVAEGRAEGLDRAAAEEQAVARFGPPTTVARQLAAAEGRVPAGLVWSTLLSLWLVGAIGLLAIGASGGVAAMMGSVVDKAFVAGDPPGVTYTAARCAEYMEYQPGAATCADAALAHHYDEVVGYRVDAGILGLLALAGWWFVRHRRVRAGRSDALPPVLVALGGTALFGLTALGLVGMGAMQGTLGGGNSAGGLLSGGLVAAVVAVAFAAWLVRSWRVPEEMPS